MIYNESDLRHLLCTKLLRIADGKPYTYCMIESHNNVGFPDMIFIDPILHKLYFAELKHSHRSYKPIEKVENIVRPSQLRVLNNLLQGGGSVFIIKGYYDNILFYDLRDNKVYKTNFKDYISFEGVKKNELK